MDVDGLVDRSLLCPKAHAGSIESNFLGSADRERSNATLQAKTCRFRRAEFAASFASHRRAAFSATTSSTGWISVGELAMTPKISLVAVCCSNDSLSSWNNRTFSMAITA